MCDFADSHASDIVVPQLGSINERWVQKKMFSRSRVDADLEEVLKTLGPTKLFRRKFLRAHDLWFPEENARLEDGIMLSKAYFLAQRVSIVTGADYYQVRMREDGENISARSLDPDEYTWAIAQVSRNILEFDPDQTRAQRIVLDLYRRKCLKFYAPDRFLRLDHERAQRLIQNYQQFQDEFIPEDLEATLDEPFRNRSRWVRAGDIEAIRVGSQIAAAGLGPKLVRWKTGVRGASMHIEAATVRGTGTREEFSLQVTKWGTSWSYSLPAHAVSRRPSDEETTAVAEFQLGWRRLLGVGSRIMDFHLLRRVGFDADERSDLVQRARVAVGVETETTLRGWPGIHPYRTAKGNFSVELSDRRLDSVLTLKRLTRRFRG